MGGINIVRVCVGEAVPTAADVTTDEADPEVCLGGARSAVGV